jgi:hypothetical protein
MKTNIRLRTKRALVVLAALVLGSGAVLLGVGQGYAFNPQPDPPGRIARLGLLTLAGTQVLRLYAVNLAIGNPDVIPQARCAVRLGFSDINGTPVFSNPPEPDFQLRPGVGTFIELDAGGFSDPEERPVRAEAFLIGNPDVKTCQIVISAQVIDKLTGVGTTFISDPNEFDLKRREDMRTQ